MKIISLFLFTFLLLISYSELSAALHQPRVGFGYTNNINLEETDKDSDSYYLLGHESTFISENFTSSIGATFQKYKKFSDYDSLNWNTSIMTAGKAEKDPLSFWNFGLGGQHFLGKNPASSDTAFDYVSGSISHTRKTISSETRNHSYTTYYDFTKYSEDANRRDHRLGLDAAYEFILGDEASLTPLFGVGFVSSSSSIYTKFFFNIGAEWLWLFAADYELATSLTFEKSIYTKRTVTTNTITQRRKKIFSSSDTTAESHNLFTAQISLTRSFEYFDLKGTFYRNKNTTNSGSEDYAELGADLALIFYFD